MISRPIGLPESNHFHAHDRGSLFQEYAYLWPGAEIIERWKPVAEVMISRALKLRPMYSAVGQKRNVPWAALAAIDMRESGCDPMGCLANGDRWDRRTVHYPVGKGPWISKEQSCHWAISDFEKGWNVNLGRVHWDICEILHLLERWNGFNPRIDPGTVPPDASGYIYSGVSFEGKPLYERGKRKEHLVNGVMKGYFDPDQADEQLGCMAFLKALEAKGFVLTAF